MALVAALLLAAASCSSEPALPPKPAIVDVAMREYRFDYEPPSGVGRVMFRVRNAGRLGHQLYLVALPGDFPSVRQLFRSSTQRLLSPVVYMPEEAPGNRATLAYDLTRGRYALICLLKGRDGKSHARNGMASEFRVR